MTATKYYDLLHQKKKAHRILNQAIREEKRKLNKELKTIHAFWFRLFDLAAVLIVLFNIGALVITNMLVVRENPNKEFKEANPVQCQTNGFACHEEAWSTIFLFFKQCILYLVLVGLYWYWRQNIVDEASLVLLGSVILFYFIALGIDFFNDLGFLLGVWAYK